MKKNKIKSITKLIFAFIFIFSFSLFSCAKQIEKPRLTISQYNLQAITSKGVVDKIMKETDYKKMHEISLAVESSRAVNCIPVGDECNLLGQILNRIVKSSTEGLPNEADNIAIYKLVNQLDKELQFGYDKLTDQWKEYINAHASENNSK